jgi:hypothetical protein
MPKAWQKVRPNEAITAPSTLRTGSPCPV